MNKTINEFSYAVKQLNIINYLVVFPIVLVFGLIGNALIVIISKYFKMASTGYKYIEYLAISDFTASVLMVFWPIAHMYGDYKHCHFVTSYGWSFISIYITNYLVNTFMKTSSFLTVALSYDRYTAIHNPIKYMSTISHKKVHIVAFMCLILSFLINLPGVFRYEILTLINSKNGKFIYTFDFRKETPGFFVYYNWFKEITLTFLPLSALIFFNFEILKKYKMRIKKKFKAYADTETSIDANTEICQETDLIAPKKNHAEKLNSGRSFKVSKQPSIKSSKTKKSLRDEFRLTTMLILIVFEYFILLTPQALVVILQNGKIPTSEGFLIFTSISNTLECLNYNLNFYIYYAFVREFRKETKNLFRQSLPSILKR